MSRPDRAAVQAVLGPTNTGKTHLAVERMCGHSSGLMGFPLRLLAREVYDRVVALKGRNEVALVTGEERIVPPHARYVLATVESMPIDRDFAFVGVDEAQLGADPERGHVFTDRLLRARGREETMILGSDALRPVLRALVPDAEVTTRPRFSTLSYAGPKKLSRLPPRSAIVAFSADEVYAVAEALRRLRGGAAVVMGALSPRTRNAQVAMYQAGEVDYLVATDAIGMGLNMDVAHVAFASLSKFDGRRRRRLTVAEMAQIAGRAGRHHRDGTFGTLTLEGGGEDSRFADEEVAAIEAHRFPRLEQLFWRDGAPDQSSVEGVIAGLERRPDNPALKAAPEAIDLAVLKRLAAEDWVRARARGRPAVQRLWAACQLPDFQKSGPEHHARLVARIYRHLSEDAGHLPQGWVAEEIARLDTTSGDIAQLSQRIAAARTWAYVANRADWLAEPAEMAARAVTLEERLSDALHERLTQRFVDRRTAVLMRDLGAKGFDALPVRIAEDGEVSVDGEAIGRLTGFRFRPDPAARHADAKMLIAAAERRLGAELRRRAHLLTQADDGAFALLTDPGRPIAIAWDGEAVARLAKGRDLTRPRVALHRSLDWLTEADRAAVLDRVERWLAAQIARHLAPLARLEAVARDPATPPGARALLAALASAGGTIERREVAATLDALDPGVRRGVTRLGVTIGALDLFAPALLKPEPVRWRLALGAVASGLAMPPVPDPRPLVPAPAEAEAARVWALAGFRRLGDQMLRVDLAERLARGAHEARQASSTGQKGPFLADPALAVSLGLGPEGYGQLMRLSGFQRAPDPADGWLWRPRRRSAPPSAPVSPGHAFARLRELTAANG